MELLIATSNRGKLAEYQEIFRELPARLIDLRTAGITTEVEETGTTFEDNARLKALGYAQASGLITVADDSGLEVMALGGEPGVYSARYGGVGLSERQRFELLLSRLRGVPQQSRQARFVCVVAIASPAGMLETFQGDLEGVIALDARGDLGFGYDPVFLLPDRAKTLAELAADEKNRISHRARAAQLAYPYLHQLISRQHDAS